MTMSMDGYGVGSFIVVGDSTNNSSNVASANDAIKIN